MQPTRGSAFSKWTPPSKQNRPESFTQSQEDASLETGPLFSSEEMSQSQLSPDAVPPISISHHAQPLFSSNEMTPSSLPLHHPPHLPPPGIHTAQTVPVSTVAPIPPPPQPPAMSPPQPPSMQPSSNNGNFPSSLMQLHQQIPNLTHVKITTHHGAVNYYMDKSLTLDANVATLVRQQNIKWTDITEIHFYHYSTDNRPSQYQPPKSDSLSTKRSLPAAAVDEMTRWYNEHISYPYPTEPQKKSFCRHGITLQQVNYWFSNRRRRSGRGQGHQVHEVRGTIPQQPLSGMEEAHPYPNSNNSEVIDMNS
ncbi:hypothetical protein P9112_002556 [Eukaryota sp. TZLM1-RC]